MKHSAMTDALPPLYGKGGDGWPWSADAPPPPEFMPDGRAWPKISIVTPNYNYGCFLEETIRSILLQGYPNLEYIIIDGGSSDESVEIIRKYEKWISYWVSESDNGQANAIDKGFRQASGDILAWLNSSDLYLPGTLLKVGSIFSQFPEVSWLTSRYPGHLWEDDRTTFKPHRKGYSRRLFRQGGYLGEAPYSLGCMQQESTFWRAKLWQQGGGGLNEALKAALDFDLWNRFFQYASPVVVDEPLSLFRVHSGQISDTDRRRYIEEGLSALGYKEGGEPALAGLYRSARAIGLVGLIGWENVCGLLYGEDSKLIDRDVNGGWRIRQLSRLRLNYRGV